MTLNLYTLLESCINPIFVVIDLISESKIMQSVKHNKENNTLRAD